MKKSLLIFGLLASGFSFGATLDTSIYSNIKTIDAVQMQRNGENLAQLWRDQKINKEISRIYKEGQGDPERMLELSKKSNLAEWIVPQMQERVNQQQVYKLNQMKLQAEIEKTNAETRLRLAKAAAPQLEYSTSTNGEKAYIEHIEDNIYKTNDDRLIKTYACYEYVYGENVLIMNKKIIFKTGKTCDIEKVIDL